jgi:hypothetical protein
VVIAIGDCDGVKALPITAYGFRPRPVGESKLSPRPLDSHWSTTRNSAVVPVPGTSSS